MQGREPNCLTQCCAIKKGCLSGIGAIRLAERSHHRATPGSLSSDCCSVLRPSCLQGTWAHLHWMCSCLWSSSSAGNKEKTVLNTEKRSLLFNPDTQKQASCQTLVQSHQSHTYSFAVIVVQRRVLIVWARQCREVLIVD